MVFISRESTPEVSVGQNNDFETFNKCENPKFQFENTKFRVENTMFRFENLKF
jgi:hypothetical protein